MINEGQFETKAKTYKSNISLDKELLKYGLDYNGGDTVYSKNKATMVSWRMKQKIIDYLKNKGKFTLPDWKGNEYFLEYNLRTKKFEIVRLLNSIGWETKWYDPVVIDVEDDPLFKRIAEIAVLQKKNANVEPNRTGKDIESVAQYANRHLKEEANYFPY